jgi:hypothetical protein
VNDGRRPREDSFRTQRIPLPVQGTSLCRAVGELERLRPLLDDGGYMPHLGHLIPPDISLSDYMYYREEKMKLIGKK